MKKHSYSYIKNFIENEKWILLDDDYIGANVKLKMVCPYGHTQYKKFSDFKTGYRCGVCYGNKKHSFDFIYNFILNENNILLSKKYKNVEQKLKIRCNNNHIFKMTFHDFQDGHRCRFCHIDNNSGENHYKYKSNREEIKLNIRLRKNFTDKWIKENMKDDPNYNNWIMNKSQYRLDHIIPVKAFTDLIIKNGYKEDVIKSIVNVRENLQILTKEENYQKFDKYNKTDVDDFLNKNNLKKN